MPKIGKGLQVFHTFPYHSQIRERYWYFSSMVDIETFKKRLSG
jgi:hypothetical protein